MAFDPIMKTGRNKLAAAATLGKVAALPKPHVMKKAASGGKNTRMFDHPTSNNALGATSSGKPPKQVVTPVSTDRGSFGIKG